MRILLWLAVSLLVPTTAVARPLEFAGINAESVITSHSEINCKTLGQSLLDCSLIRSRFGDVPIGRSLVLGNNATHKVVLVSIGLDWLFADDAVEVLTAKYGPAKSDVEENKVNKQGGPYKARTVKWPEFDGGARISLYRGEKDASVDIVFPQNREAKEPPKIDF